MGAWLADRLRPDASEDSLGLLDSLLVGAASAMVSTVFTILAVDAWTGVDLVTGERVALLAAGTMVGGALTAAYRAWT